ncbi:putative short-chain dehydrogenase reductase [Erysiphe necator]|uniref:Putative short-chain dehydrogenase reductase n=1 Tax=Uncinula necator TaxID=52586 RepID=A0A0B1NVU9_UNCNE|nr:putative short-chain dehydrogenase reductase [Erysiphe necator]
MAWAFVTPASRGIGFHLTRHLLQHTKLPIVATARKDVAIVKKSILSELPVSVDEERLKVLPLDVTGNKKTSFFSFF